MDNELEGEPVVDCDDTMVSLTFKTKKPFTGRVYVLGMADDERCARNFAANADQQKFSMMIQNGDCTMQRQRVTGTLEGMVNSVTIVVSFHGTFVTKADRAFRCMCFFRNIKRLTSAIDMNSILTTDLLDTAKTPGCSYSIHAQTPDGPPVSLGHVGDKIYHVHSCAVDDGRGAKFDLLDIDGCAIDPVISGDLTYDERGNKAFVETSGYRFSDTSVLNYQCIIELCKKESGECHGLTPPICGRQKRHLSYVVGGGKQRRNDSSLDQVDVLASMKIVDNLREKGIPVSAESILSGKESVELLTSVNDNDPRQCLLSLAVGFAVTILTASVFTLLSLYLTLWRRKY
ncbi:Zona pellucida-like domain containing protein [Aphelenchoides avenae]|nr:Zona pellucida-like domain containing protein [Aphelenchus avenae]